MSDLHYNDFLYTETKIVKNTQHKITYVHKANEKKK